MKLNKDVVKRGVVGFSTLAAFVGLGIWAASSGELAMANTADASSIEPTNAKQTPGNDANQRSASARLMSLSLNQQAPEDRLIGIYQHLLQGQLGLAISASESLMAEHPNFDLVRLTYADLLSIRSGQPHEFTDPQNATTQHKRLNELRLEASKRIQSQLNRPAPGMVPTQIVALPSTVPYVVTVDASNNRLYLYRNGEKGQELVLDFYTSVGKEGFDKSVEGDQRTPLGVYFTTFHMSKKQTTQLDDLYGSGAMPLNYPNTYDKLLSRTGSGIWLHGVPFTTFARAPQATDGCVAMANEDFERLFNLIPRNTPVIISQKLQWQPRGQVVEEKAEFLKVWQQWAAQRTLQTQGNIQSLPSTIRQAAQNNRKLDTFYIATTNGGSGPASDHLSTRDNFDRGKYQEKAARGPSRIDQFNDLSALAWQGAKAPTMVTTFIEGSATEGLNRTKRQYWERSPQGWVIRAEVNLG